MSCDAQPVNAEGGFWTVNADTLATTIVVGLLAFGFLWWVTRKVSSGVTSSAILADVPQWVSCVELGRLGVVRPVKS